MNNYKLRDLLTIHNGKDYRKLASGKIPVYGTGGLMTYVNDFLYDGESILLPRKGTLDNIMYVSSKFWTVDTMYWTVVNSEIVYPKSLYYYLSLLDLSAKNTGSVLPSMTYDSYYDLDIQLPTLDYQVKVADYISNIDSKITNNKDISKQLESMAKTIYDYWFLQFEFPDKDGKPYKSNGGKMIWNDQLKQEIPGGWEVKELQDLAKLGNGINYNKNIKGNEKCKIVNVRDITSSSLLINSHKLTHLSLPKKSMEKYIIKKTDILIARSGTPGAVRILPSTTEKVIFAGFIIHCLPKDSELRWYLTFMLKKFEGTNVTTTGGSILKNVSQNSLKSISIILPSSVVLKRFNKQIIPIIEQLENILEENQQLKSLRNFLLPMLMNGQVSISD